MAQNNENSEDGENNGNYGITWNTEYNLDITGAAQNTIIMGESSELVAGASGTAEVGGSVDVFLLELLEITLGFRQVLSNDCKFNFSTEEHEVKELKEKVAAKLNEIVIGAKMKAVDAEVKAAEGNVKVAADAWKAHDQHYNAVVEKSKLCATKNEVDGAKQQVAAEVNRALAEQTETLGDKALVVGQDTQNVAAKTQTLASHVKTALEQTKNIAAATHLVAEETTLSAVINKL